MPQKTFEFARAREPTRPLALPDGESAQAALARVLALPAVGSKRFLTTKADRSVTGAAPRCLRAPRNGCRAASLCGLCGVSGHGVLGVTEWHPVGRRALRRCPHYVG